MRKSVLLLSAGAVVLAVGAGATRLLVFPAVDAPPSSRVLTEESA
jgi:hypothetical protein